MSLNMTSEDAVELPKDPPRKRTKLLSESENNNAGFNVAIEPRSTDSAIMDVDPTCVNNLPSHKSISAERKTDSTWSYIDELRDKEANEILKCKEYILKMKAATLRQKNISADVKKGLVYLEEGLERLESVRSSIIDAENKLKFPGCIKKSHSKCASAVKSGSSLIERDKKPRKQLDDSETDTAMSGFESETGEWRTAQRKKSKTKQLISKKDEFVNSNKSKLIPSSKQKNIRIRPDAILIKPATGKSYSDVLSHMRSQGNPENISINSVRRTKKGDILVELGGQTEEKQKFKSHLEAVLGESANIKDLEQVEVLEIRDLDEFTTEEEVRNSIQETLASKNMDMKVVLSKPNDRMQKLAFVTIGSRAAFTLIEKARIRIGWINARIRRKAVVLRCYNCAGYGHVSSSCKGPDRRGHCYNCGLTGHVQKDCTSTPKCFVCVDSKINGDVNHKVGTTACPEYKKALEEAKTKLR